MLALSIVSPHGLNIAAGLKNFEIRSWRPEFLPIRNLLVVENSKFSSIDYPTDPNGKAVAVVDIEEIHEWQPSEVAEACSSGWESGYWVWSLSMCALFQPSRLSQPRESFTRLIFRMSKPNDWFKPFASLTGTG